MYAFLLLLSTVLSAVLQRDTPIPNRFIIRLKPSVTTSQFTRQLHSTIEKHSNVEGDAKRRILHTYTHAISGYAAKLTPAMKAELESDPHVSGIEPDFQGSFDVIIKQASPPSWGLTRASEKKLDLSQPYEYLASAGEGVTAYVIDSGIDTNHTDFGGRATFGPNFVKDEPPQDLQGHGSHVAGTIGSNSYGIAKKVKLVAIKACGESDCAVSNIIAGIDWVIANGVPMKSVINMSLNFPGSDAMDDSVNKAVAKGIAVIVSAGNTYANSCERSPRRAKDAFAIGAADNTDTKADFSSFGPCLRVWAPGVDIISVKPGGGDQPMSGTSMASPHVAGIAAVYLAENKYANILELHSDLIKRSEQGLVKNVPENTNTTNFFVYSLPRDE